MALVAKFPELLRVERKPFETDGIVQTPKQKYVSVVFHHHSRWFSVFFKLKMRKKTLCLLEDLSMNFAFEEGTLRLKNGRRLKKINHVVTVGMNLILQQMKFERNLFCFTARILTDFSE